MIPSPWVAVILTLAAFRLTRLAGWDDFPPVARTRVWLLGTTITPRQRPGGEDDVYVYTYRRPLLAHLLGCAFCIGAWLSLGVYLFWIWEPTATLYVAVPFALSAAVGLIAKNLDP